MILGIDFGISTTDVALIRDCRLLKAFYVESGSLGSLEKSISEHGISLPAVEKIAVTGGRASLKRLFGRRVSRENELRAIGFGGAFLSGLDNALVVSMGTGTCMVSFKGGKVRHAAGTALGGGTITGLSKRLLGEQGFERLEKLASKGKPGKIDLSVREAIGSGIGLAPGNATASNFAKQGKVGKADIALAVQNMVAESNAVIAALAARSCGHKRIVFVGKAPGFRAVRASLKKVLSYYGFSPVFPAGGGQATAAGAALLQGNCFK